MGGVGKKWANVMLMNHLDLESMEFVSFAGLVPISEERNSKKMSSQRIEMYPISFNGTGIPNNGRKDDKYILRTNWNYA